MSLPDVTQGSFPLEGTADLPNVTVAFPGEHWSNRKASGSIVPGEAVIPVNSGGHLYMRTAGASDAITQLAIALRPIDPPDPNTGPSSLGPNEIVNQTMEAGDYVHAYYSGVFHLTLVVPTTYAPGDLIGWDADGVRPSGKSGTGAWAKNSAADIDSVFEVMEVREVNSTTHECILTCRSLRGQF